LSVVKLELTPALYPDTKRLFVENDVYVVCPIVKEHKSRGQMHPMELLVTHGASVYCTTARNSKEGICIFICSVKKASVPCRYKVSTLIHFFII
jgi:hypothetical protein